MSATTAYPVHVDATLDRPLSRWLWLVKWILVIPHYVVLAFLWIAFAVLSLVAFFAILFTGRYPRPIFDFNVGVLRWAWRVAYYAYGALGTDRYPPFSLGEVPDYPAHLDVDYPEHLSRGLVLVKTWLLAIPHYVVVGFFLGAGTAGVAWTTNDGRWTFGPVGLVGILVAVAAVVMLVTGAYPRPVFDFVLGMNRWALRVAGYAALMTDTYPPFRLDLGGHDPDVGLSAEPPVPVATRRVQRWGAGSVVAVVVGSLLMLPAFAVALTGAAALVIGGVARDDAGFVTSSAIGMRSEGVAVISEPMLIQTDVPDLALPRRMLGDVRVRATAQGPSDAVFIGIGRTGDVLAYLATSRYDRIDGITRNSPRYTTVDNGSAALQPPASRQIWSASSTGQQASMTWGTEPGDWTMVVMNADAARGVAVRADIGATVPALTSFAVGLLVAGLVGVAVAAIVIVMAVRAASVELPAPTGSGTGPTYA
jgi:Domain of unknown function (DUF4389)